MTAPHLLAAPAIAFCRLESRQVCRRWRTLCNASQLQRSLSVHWYGHHTNVPRRAQSLLAHMLRHGQHVRELQLTLTCTDEAVAEVIAVVSSSLVLANGLQSLYLSVVNRHAVVTTAAWLPALRMAQRVDSRADGQAAAGWRSERAVALRDAAA